MELVSVKELVESGAHLGHTVSRWNPRMKQFIFGKHTGSTAVEDKLRSRHIEVSKEQVQALVNLIKEFSEGKSKVDPQAFVELFHEREDRRRGVTDDEFWALASKVGIRAPPT